jgi:hypothetical protein
MRKVFVSFLIIIFSFFVLPQLALITQSQTLNIDESEVVYPLPYPGILTDHPLYFIKQIRDDILIFTTRDNIKKAQLYLHLSDKHVATALQLAQKGKDDLSQEELMKSEDYFLEVPTLLEESKEQGASSSAGFIDKLEQSNKKHKEVITEVMKEVNDPEVSTFKTILDKNNKAQQELKHL